MTETTTNQVDNLFQKFGMNTPKPPKNPFQQLQKEIERLQREIEKVNNK